MMRTHISHEENLESEAPPLKDCKFAVQSLHDSCPSLDSWAQALGLIERVHLQGKPGLIALSHRTNHRCEGYRDRRKCGSSVDHRRPDITPAKGTAWRDAGVPTRRAGLKYDGSAADRHSLERCNLSLLIAGYGVLQILVACVVVR